MQAIVCLCVIFLLTIVRLRLLLVFSYFPWSRFSSASVDINSVFLRLRFDRGLVRICYVCLVMIGLQRSRQCVPFCSPWIHSILFGFHSCCYISLSSFSELCFCPCRFFNFPLWFCHLPLIYSFWSRLSTLWLYLSTVSFPLFCQYKALKFVSTFREDGSSLVVGWSVIYSLSRQSK